MFVNRLHSIFLFNLMLYIILKRPKYKHYALSHSERYLQLQTTSFFLALKDIFLISFFFPKKYPFQ